MKIKKSEKDERKIKWEEFPQFFNPFWRAAKLTKEIEELEPSIAQNYIKRGALYLDCCYNGGDGDFDADAYRGKAEADYAEAIRLKPENAEYYAVRGEMWNKGNYHKNIADYTEAIRLEPKNAFYHSRRGVRYKSGNDYINAMADLSEAIRLMNSGGYSRGYKDFSNLNRCTISYYYYERGEVYFTLGNYDSAIADYTKAIDTNSKTCKFDNVLLLRRLKRAIQSRQML